METNPITKIWRIKIPINMYNNSNTIMQQTSTTIMKLMNIMNLWKEAFIPYCIFFETIEPYKCTTEICFKCNACMYNLACTSNIINTIYFLDYFLYEIFCVVSKINYFKYSHFKVTSIFILFSNCFQLNSI